MTNTDGSGNWGTGYGVVDSAGNWDLGSVVPQVSSRSATFAVSAGNDADSRFPAPPAGNYQVRVVCQVEDNATYPPKINVTQTYQPSNFTVTGNPLVVGVSPAPGIVGRELTYAPKSPCPIGSQRVRVQVAPLEQGGSYGVAEADVSGNGSWGPLRASLDGAAPIGRYSLSASCSRATGRGLEEQTTLTYRRTGFDVIARAPSRTSFIAMGDSFSSGEGNQPYDSETNTRANTCHRSPNAWPRLMASSGNSQSVLLAHIACSGATIENLTRVVKTETGQIDQLKKLATPKVITITLGGNDIGFGSILSRCVTVNCVNDVKSAQFNIARRGGLTDALVVAYRQIKSAVPGARLVVVGYPNIFPTTKASAINCGWLTDQERPALVQLATDLENGIRKAAQAAGAEYVSTLGAVKGHELCTKDSWMYPLANSNPTNQQQGHPLINGQRAIRDIVRPVVERP